MTRRAGGTRKAPPRPAPVLMGRHRPARRPAGTAQPTTGRTGASALTQKCSLPSPAGGLQDSGVRISSTSLMPTTQRAAEPSRRSAVLPHATFNPVLHVLDLLVPVASLGVRGAWLATGPAQWAAAGRVNRDGLDTRFDAGHCSHGRPQEGVIPARHGLADAPPRPIIDDLFGAEPNGPTG